MTDATKGRTTALVEQTLDGLNLRFQDGATLRLKGQIDPGHQVAPGASVVQACERQDRLELHFSQGPPAAFSLANPGNAVSVRDAAGKVVYLG
ncbi:MAG TPA: hypothetical protein VGD78_07335 [Chthoniobacterales bacterium]